MSRISRINIFGVAAFGLSAPFAVVQSWSLPEFCWSTWLAGLFYTWLWILTVVLQAILAARPRKAEIEERLPFLRMLSPLAFLLLVTTAAVAAALLAFIIFNYIFGFYGLFLSVFAEMEPLQLFGRNGFINSDFHTPVVHLLNRYWPVTAGVIISSFRLFLQPIPWKHLVQAPGRELLRIHVFILATPFFSLLAWLLLGTAWQPLAVVLLMALLYFLPGRVPTGEPLTGR